MKNSENLMTPTSEKKAPRAGSKAHLESLKTHLDEILEWETKIKAAQGKEEQVLRKAFKDKYNTTFNVKLMEKLTGESRSLEIKEQKKEQPEEIIEMKAAKMNEMVAADIKKEETAAIEKDLKKNPEFNREANQIDAERKEVVQESVSQVKDLVNGGASDKKIEKINTKALINQVNSFENLLTTIKDHNLSIQGSSELFTPEMLQDVIIKIKSREFPLSAATNRDGFRAKIAELLQSDSNIDDLKIILKDVESKLLSESHVIGASTDHPLDERQDQRLKWKERLGQSIYQIEENKKRSQETSAKKEQTEEELRQEILATKEQVMADIEKDKQAEFKAAELEAKEALAEDMIFQNDKETKNSPEEPKSEMSQEKEAERYSSQVVESFKKLSLSPDDLETVPGLVDLPETAQMMIAKSLQAMAFEGTKNKVAQEEAKKMQNKGFFGRMGQGIVNSFKSKSRHREALIEQRTGGLEKHGAHLVSMVDWAKTFIPSESVNEKGEKQIDFISLPPNFKPNNEEGKVFDDFNKVAMALASLPKHNLVKFDSVPKDSPEYEKAKEYYDLRTLYKRGQAEIREMLAYKTMHGKEVARQLFNADAKLNMMQFLAADPNLEKEWTEMLKKEPWYKNLYKTAGKYISANSKFFAGGFVARQGVSMTFASTFGIATGVVAIPLVAAAIGAWRGKERANKYLKKQDKFVDKKSLSDHPLLTNRRKALQELQSILPLYNELEDESLKNKSGRMSYEEWSNIASPEDLNKYQQAKAKFDKLDLKWQRTENKNVDKKTLKSENLVKKIEDLINKYNQVATTADRDSIAGAIQRRLDFSKRLADDGLVNFGSIEERNERMKDFYSILNETQLGLFYFDYDNLDLSYEVASKEAGTPPEIIKVQERAEDLIEYFEYKVGEKLDKKRKDFVIRSMIKGAVLGATFASAGSAAYGGINSLIQNSAEGVAAGASAAAAAAEETISNTDGLTSSASEEALNVSESAPVIVNNDIPVEVPPPAPEPIVSEESIAPVAESGPSSWSDVVSNESLKPGQHDSVWRSTREIFLNNAESLGYEGDEEGLAKWAEIQTNRALANSGEIADKVFEGNQIILEKVDDVFVVSVEQGDGLEPGQLPEEITRVESISKIESRPITQVTEGASSIVSGDASAKVIENVINNAKSLEVSPTAINKWLATVGEKFSLVASEMVYQGDNIVKTIIGGQEIFIDPIKDQYYFFNDVGDELSGFLVNDQGEVVNNVKEFLAEKFALVPIDNLGEEASEGVNQFVNQSEGLWSGEEITEGTEAEDVWSGADTGEEAPQPDSVEDIVGSNESPEEIASNDAETLAPSAVDNDLGDNVKSWDDLSPLEQKSEIMEFLDTNKGLKFRLDSNNIGMMLSANSHLPIGELAKEALKSFSEFTGIENLVENISDKEIQELNKIIENISNNGYTQPLHSRKLAGFAAKLMFNRGDLSL